MGRKYDDPEVQKALKLVPYAVSKAPNGDLRVSLACKEYYPTRNLRHESFPRSSATQKAYLGRGQSPRQSSQCLPISTMHSANATKGRR